MKAHQATRNRILFCVIVVLWVFFDRWTKAIFEGFALGQPGVDLGGILEFSLVHNYGAAWGSFSGMTIALIVVTLFLCAVIVLYAFIAAKQVSVLEMVGLALVFAGGVGNLIDRVVNGYVIDFITPLFIDFPTFNIADTGITCGIVLIVIAWVIRFFSEHEQKSEPGH